MRWGALAAIAIAQLMVVLDVTVMNIALPTTQQELGFSDAGRQWVIAAYGLTFGSLLLVGGRVNDRWGRRNLDERSRDGPPREAPNHDPTSAAPMELRP